MPAGVKQVTLTFASGATSTNAQYVGNHARAFVVASAMTNYNAGTGNASIFLQGNYSNVTGTFARIPSATIATMSIKSIIPMANPGMPWLKVEFGTAVTGGAANTIDLIVCDDS